jgi:hypothetical protein
MTISRLLDKSIAVVAADLAVRAGAEYLPREPRTAVQVAAAYAEKSRLRRNSSRPSGCR